MIVRYCTKVEDDWIGGWTHHEAVKKHQHPERQPQNYVSTTGVLG